MSVFFFFFRIIIFAVSVKSWDQLQLYQATFLYRVWHHKNQWCFSEELVSFFLRTTGHLTAVCVCICSYEWLHWCAQSSLVVISLTDIVFGESYELTQRKLYCPTNVKYL